ncbi:hypothetical protein PENTCL1PPCAC_21790, partial [Pristionchus entomophagus]
LLHKCWESLQSERNWDLFNDRDDYDFCAIAVSLLEHNLNDNILLTKLLGMGLLRVARIVAASNVPHFGWARVFGRVLNRHPEWKPAFKEMTKHGNAHNPTVALGLSILFPTRIESAWYVIEDEENDEDL